MQFKKGKAEDEIVSHLGEGTELKGEITFTKGLQVDGVIKGKVRSEALLLVGTAGKADAEVDVRRILIRGEFHGAIHASDRVEILKEGKVFGDIFTPCLIIEAGAIFEGHCYMLEQKKTQTEKGKPSTAKSGAAPAESEA
jgi:cytoskeletal protein CcmA (bactofilin family)